jgi:hypothetical protein
LIASFSEARLVSSHVQKCQRSNGEACLILVLISHGFFFTGRGFGTAGEVKIVSWFFRRVTMLPRFANNADPNSMASRFRGRRNESFRAMALSAPKPLRILDVGGRETIWSTMGFASQSDVSIVLLNVEPVKVSYSNITSVTGDARHMQQFGDKEFDFVFSNSVIEHVGDFVDRQLMADEIKRVGRRYFVQTPYRYFPIEPHFVFPGFQFLPFAARAALVRRFSLGHYPRQPDQLEAEKTVRSIQLLSRRELRSLFPDAQFENERLFGITKSLLAIKV